MKIYTQSLDIRAWPGKIEMFYFLFTVCWKPFRVFDPSGSWDTPKVCVSVERGRFASIPLGLEDGTIQGIGQSAGNCSDEAGSSETTCGET